MSRAFCASALAIVVSAAGILFNSLIAFHLITLSRSYKSDVVESEWEWESSSTFSGIDAPKLASSLLSLYFFLSAVFSAVGFLGALRRIPAYIRLYRDYWLADLSLSSFATLVTAAASFYPSVRNSICEEISRQPQLTRQLVEVGLDLEECEPWLERAVIAGVGIMSIILIVRLQFLVVLTRLYRHLLHIDKGWQSLEDGSTPLDGITCQRIFVLPVRENLDTSNSPMVYAPVLLSSLSNEETQDLQETEVWFSRKDHRKLGRATHRRSPSVLHHATH